MTLQQLRYAVEIADRGSFNEAAKALFVSQPSLSAAIRELENEVHLTIFVRTSKGTYPSADGSEFLGYARQVLLQSALLEEKYLSGAPRKQKFSVSTHHYLFAANAFVELVKQFGGEDYEFSYREAKTWEVIEDVHSMRSELGLIYLDDFNEAVIRRLLEDDELRFDELFAARPHVFLCNDHPLAALPSVTLEQLDAYPRVSFEQGEHNSFYFSEEILSTRSVRRSIKVSDRAAMVNFMIGLNGYTVCTGVFPEFLHGDDICAVPLEVDDRIRVGTVMRRDTVPSLLGGLYLEALRRIAADIASSYSE